LLWLFPLLNYWKNFSMKSHNIHKTLSWENNPNFNKLNNYKDWLEDKNFTKETIENYLATIIQYGDRKIETKDINNFFREILKAKKYQPATLRSKRNALASYCKFLKINIDWERIRRILPTEQRKPYPILTEDEFRQILSANTYTDKLTNERNNLILEFLWYLGIRINELINIRHYDYREGWLRVHGKGNKYRSLLLPPFLVPYFDPYSKDFLFLTRHGKPLTKGQIRRNINKKAKLAGIKKKISPHSFRRSLATNSHNKGTRLDTIQKQLGHTNLNTTIAYINNDYQSYYDDCSKYWVERILCK
jgi:integrase/recombinase XerD